MGTVIGEKSRITGAGGKEQFSGLMETDTWVSGRRITCTAMEYTDGQMEEYITGSGKTICAMVTDI